ncbi:hypothetical protein D5S18_02975 [Nocardia panacis]|uniref:Uncharacterized protein n=1 Tax=Nocardia panacis TaxID=2340916 RepID=A0A3A4KI66_9NOCA|nr:hypothetical protein [Nocardia panacis]RJO79309.1 hypothetical protein D5S18_02975 [Nocardia panacis]
MADIGTERLSWSEFGTLIAFMPRNGESALYRARNPRSWWWTQEMDFLAAILYAVQGANWQRSGGQGEAPKPVARPNDAPVAADPDTVPLDRINDELAARRKALIGE